MMLSQRNKQVFSGFSGTAWHLRSTLIFLWALVYLFIVVLFVFFVLFMFVCCSQLRRRVWHLCPTLIFLYAFDQFFIAAFFVLFVFFIFLCCSHLSGWFAKTPQKKVNMCRLA